jgi:FtsH-binding integral membrane protein
MEAVNPYAVNAATSAAMASADARATFLQKTYALLLAGVFGFAFTLWAAGNVPAVRGLAVGLWGTSPWLVLILALGGGWLVHTMAERSPINLVLYFAYVFLLGLVLAPLVLYAANNASGALTQASLMTAITFGGLTGYVFASRKDFSFLGGALSIGFFAMLGIAIAGMLFGFTPGLWYSVAGVVLFAGYVLYDTSQILHRYPTTAHVSAAVVLFVDVVMLFQHILMLLLRSRD